MIIIDSTNKLHEHKPKSIVENETNNVLWDFESQADYLISVRRPDRVIVKKKKKKKKKKE